MKTAREWKPVCECNDEYDNIRVWACKFKMLGEENFVWVEQLSEKEYAVFPNASDKPYEDKIFKTRQGAINLAETYISRYEDE